jgi:thiosulfate/3-mercaptopyruvate sulfurtransferase
MINKETMIKDVAGKAVLPLIGATILVPAFQPGLASERGRTAVRSEMLVSTAWLEEHLNDRDLVILQIGQNRAQFDAGHIPGSRFVRLDELVEQRAISLNELPSVADLKETFESLGVGDQSRIVLVDESGGVLAARAYFTLDYLGHGDHAALLNGGLRKWVGEARIWSKKQVAAVRQEFRPRINQEILVNTAQMRQMSLDSGEHVSDYVLLDARPVAEHVGIVKSESVPQAGHISGSRSLYWKKLTHSDSTPQLLDVEELQRQFQNAGATPGKAVITYCRTGMQSSFTYFVARYLGYKAAMYDGSVYEWVRTPGNALVRSPEATGAITAHQ